MLYFGLHGLKKIVKEDIVPNLQVLAGLNRKSQEKIEEE